MDDYMFKQHVQDTRVCYEATQYVEIVNYSDPQYNIKEEHSLKEDDFENFLHGRGASSPKKVPEGVKQLSSFRMVLQQNANHPDTFSPHWISLSKAHYVSMVEAFKLPYRGIESTSAVGPFFWCALDQDEEDPTLQILFRKSDVRKKGKTRGWELMLSHNLKTQQTNGYCKGTESSDIIKSVEHLKACAAQITHPMLLPTIILSLDLSSKTDQKQRDTRDWIRRLENAVSMRNEIDDKEGYVDKDGVVDLDLVNRDLVECHSQVLWKRPKAYVQIVDAFKEAMDLFSETCQTPQGSNRWADAELRKLHASMSSRHTFIRRKLQGLESYAYISLQRLDIQRAALYNIIAQRESKLNFQMAAEQKKLAHAAKRDSGAQKTIALLGALFLPGAWLASVFSMSFFNFQNGLTDDGGNPDLPIVAEEFWIYWAVTIPVTAIIVGIWFVWERRRDRRYMEEDTLLEQGVEQMEKDIQRQMRARTMSKAETWNLQNGRK